MTIFRTLDIILWMVMICMAGFTYKVKYDVQKRINEVGRLEREIAAEKNMVNLLHAEWAVMIEPSRMQKLAKRYQKELNLEMIQPRQIVGLEDIPMRLYDQIDEVIKQNTLEENKGFLANNHISHMNGFVQKGMR
ncbi:cell division protein FtsL [Bartonella sp. B35(2025)]